MDFHSWSLPRYQAAAKILRSLHVLDKVSLSPRAFGSARWHLEFHPPKLTPRADFFDGFTKRHPVYAPFTTPVYSNAAFQILGYVIEKVAGEPYELAIQNSILKPLSLSRTSLKPPTSGE